MAQVPGEEDGIHDVGPQEKMRACMKREGNHLIVSEQG